MLTSCLPFFHDDLAELYEQVQNGQYSVPESINKDTEDFLSKLL